MITNTEFKKKKKKVEEISVVNALLQCSPITVERWRE